MAWTKAKMVVAVGVGVLLAAGTTTIAVKQIQQYVNKDYLWQLERIDSNIFDKVPQLVRMLPAKFPKSGGTGVSMEDGRSIGIGYSIGEIFLLAYGGNGVRMIYAANFPTDRFENEKHDYITSLHTEPTHGLQRELQHQFGLVGKFVTVETNVYLLQIKQANQNLRLANKHDTSSTSTGNGAIVFKNTPLPKLTGVLEGLFRIPIINRTGLTNNFNFALHWNQYGEKVGNQFPNYPNPVGLKQALTDQLGLELVPSREPVEMLVVERVK